MGDDNCVGDLVCEATLPGQPNRCTKTCAADTDCMGARWIGAQSWCEATALHICLPLLDNDVACPKDSACKSGHCSTATNKCVATGGA
jgi:hypothetical protein